MKTGVYFSRCSGAFDGVIDLEALAGQYSGLESAMVFEDFFAADVFSTILADVESKELDAVVLAGDSHYSYKQTRNGEYLFKCLEEKGVNRNRVEIVNLKNMAAAPHRGGQRHLLSQKAKLLIDAALEKIRCSHDISMVEVSPRKAVAIVGVTSSSFVVAQHLLDEGYKVFLVNDKNDISLTPEESSFIQPTLVYVTRHPRFTIYNGRQAVDFNGYPGDFNLKIAAGDSEIEIPVGAVVLSLQGNSALIKTFQSVFHIDVNKDGSLAALDEVTARSLTQDRGLFVINPIKVGEGDLGQGIMSADATASMVINLLNRKEIYHGVQVSEVRAELCSGCGACVKTCMFRAVTLFGTPGISHIDPRRCRGCGNCVTACPADARDLVSSPNRALFGSIEIFSQLRSDIKVLLIACDGCGYRCLNSAAEAGLSWPEGVMPLRVVCGGQIDTRLIMHAFVKGFDAVALAICGEGCCHNIIGNVDLERRANLFREILSSRGIAEDRMKVIATCSRKGQECVDSLNEFCRQFDPIGEAASTVLFKG